MEDSGGDDIRFNSQVSKGNPKIRCSKIYLRAPIRQEISKKLRSKSVQMYRIAQAAEEMDSGEDEAADLYSQQVLARVKSDELASEHIDAFPLRAIEKIKRFTMPNTIHFIGTDPPLIIYWTHF